MTNGRKHALVLSCEVPGEEPLPGARYNAEKLSKFFRRANVPSGFSYGSRLTLDRAKEDINHFFSSESDLHILYGIFHGHAGSWKLSDGTTLGLHDILEQWDLAKRLGTARQLLIVSDACESGQMVNEAEHLGRGDIAVQASCAGSNETRDTEGETFTELLLWKLQGKNMKRGRDERICSVEMALLNFGPCYYCPDRSNYRGWIFVDEDGSDQSSQCFSLKADSSDMTSQLSSAEPDDAPSPGPDNIGRTDNASNQEANSLRPEDAPPAGNDEQIGVDQDNMSNQEASRIAWNYERTCDSPRLAVFFSFSSFVAKCWANYWILVFVKDLQKAMLFNEPAFYRKGAWSLSIINTSGILSRICYKYSEWLVQNKRSIASRALPEDILLQIPQLVAPPGTIEAVLKGFLDVLKDSMVLPFVFVKLLDMFYNKFTRHALLMSRQAVPG